MESKRRVWLSPWGFTESIAIVVGIVVIGFAIQLSVGQFDFYLLAYPVNVVVGAAILLFATVLSLGWRTSRFMRWLSGVELSITLIIAIMTLAIIMGFTPQVSSKAVPKLMLGFDAMTSSWSFVMIYGLLLLSLGTLVVRRLMSFKWDDFLFHLNHVGLWLVLAFSGLGYADMERYIMFVNEGETQWRVYDESGAIIELPIAIKLNDFDMEVYPPKLAIIDRATGEVQPQDRPQFFQIDQDSPKGELNGWQVEVKEYLHEAVRSSDSTYREVHMPGALPAAYVEVSAGVQHHKGWVCAGNQSQLPMVLNLSDDMCMVMTTAEPRLFRSDVELYSKDGNDVATTLEVNHPLRVGAWTIYQYGYDNNAGRQSSYSSFELVYDPYLFPVYLGIAMMMLGGLLMVWRGRKTKGYELE